jgi:hypothetical protein
LWTDAGHQVIALIRNPAKAEMLPPPSAEKSWIRASI